MNTEDLIYTLYSIPLLLSLKSYLYTARVYERLPEKLPMNFDFSGKVNTWWSKNLFSAYFLPFTGFLITIFMAGALFFVSNDTGPLPDDFALAFWFLDFSLVYLLDKSQQAIMEYSTEQYLSDTEKCIWPKLNKGFLLLALASVGLASLLFIDTQPDISSAVFCESVENKQAINVREHFSNKDSQVFLLLNLENIKGEHIVRTEWFNPQGQLYFKYQHKTHHKILAKRLKLWSYINVRQSKSVLGQWRINIYINNEKVLTKEFTMTN